MNRSGGTSTKKAQPPPAAASTDDVGGRATAAMLRATADWWERAGFAPEGDTGYVTVPIDGGTVIHDAGTRLRVVGGISDEAVRLIAMTGATRWGGAMKLNSAWSQADVDRLHVASRRLSPAVEVRNGAPSVAAVAAAEREAGRRESAKSDGAKAAAFRRYASGGSARDVAPELIAFCNRNHGVEGQVRDMIGADLALFVRQAEAEGRRILISDPAAGIPHQDDNAPTPTFSGARPKFIPGNEEGMTTDPQMQDDHEDVRRRNAAADARDEARRRLTDEEAEDILRRWIASGFGAAKATEAEIDAAGGYPHVVVQMGDGEPVLRDFGDRVEIDGPVTEEACRRLALVAAERWNGRCRLQGAWATSTPNPDADRYWLACQRLSPPVEIENYTPGATARAKAEKEVGRRVQAVADGRLAGAARRYAAGESDATTAAVRAWVNSNSAAENQDVMTAVGADAALQARRGIAEGAKVLKVRPDAGKSNFGGGEPEPAGGQAQGAVK